jgi:hypothetical protein
MSEPESNDQPERESKPDELSKQGVIDHIWYVVHRYDQVLVDRPEGPTDLSRLDRLAFLAHDLLYFLNGRSVPPITSDEFFDISRPGCDLYIGRRRLQERSLGGQN